MQTIVSLLFTTPIFLFFFGPLDPVDRKRLLDKPLGEGPAFFNRVQVGPCLLFPLSARTLRIHSRHASVGVRILFGR